MMSRTKTVRHNRVFWAVAVWLVPFALSAGRVVYSEDDLQLYIQKWQVRDGEAARVVSDYFCTFVIESPETFLRVTSGSGVLKDWLSQLADLSFVDSGEDCLNRECLRKRMIEALSLASVSAATRGARDELLEHLKRIKIRRIN